MEMNYRQKNNFLRDLKKLNYPLSNCIRLVDYYSKKNDRFAICLLDINNFRYYNYIFGYDFGDRMMETISHKIQQCIEGNGYVNKLHGSVLMILLYGVNCKSDIIKIIEKIENLFNDYFEVKNEKSKLLVNIGISIYPDDSKRVDVVFRYAEIALNHAKKVHPKKYMFFDAQMYKNIIRMGKIATRISKAINDNEFTVYYQPQIDICTMQVYGMEALLRWDHPEYGILSPIYFIDMIEQNGVISEIGRLVFYEACKEIKKLHNSGKKLNMSINVSPRQLEDSFLVFINNVLEETEVEPQYISIEITERVLVNPSDSIIKILTELRDKGIKIFIDDFGTKYSSLNYLYRLPVDGIKIDKSFVDNIQNSKKEFIITKNIIRLAHELNLEVVAEGVEEYNQLECLKNMKCSKIQGFIFGKPVTSSEFESLFLNSIN